METASWEATRPDDCVVVCPRCEQQMLVACQHLGTPVGCPRCGAVLRPWTLVDSKRIPKELRSRTEAQSTTEQMQPRPRRREVAGWLGVFLGPFGVHRFYLGYTSVGVAQIALTCFTGMGAIWGIIEGILLLTGQGIQADADGKPLAA